MLIAKSAAPDFDENQDWVMTALQSIANGLIRA
jgi:hypothetical protein